MHPTIKYLQIRQAITKHLQFKKIVGFDNWNLGRKIAIEFFKLNIINYNEHY